MRVNSIIENPISITVLVPCYNGAQTINRCFNSILNQDYPMDFLKILCVDDGSHDDSLKIIQRFRKKFPNRISVIHQKNHGISYTRQKLLENVLTPYFIFCDVDDYFANEAIRNLFIASNYGEADATVSKAYRLAKNGHRRV
jgi:glycosyltransferase involved in cell wall biosynthesis